MSRLLILYLVFLVALSGCGGTKAPPPTTPVAAPTKHLPAKDLVPILNILLSEDSPMVNLRSGIKQVVVSWPPLKGNPPASVRGTTFILAGETEPGHHLMLNVISFSPKQLQMRVDYQFFDAETGFASEGAEWQEIVFEKLDGQWKYKKTLAGAIK